VVDPENVHVLNDTCSGCSHQGIKPGIQGSTMKSAYSKTLTPGSTSHEGTGRGRNILQEGCQPGYFLVGTHRDIFSHMSA
jgi:hypothetical protein